jgi:hypothetical protein
VIHSDEDTEIPGSSHVAKERRGRQDNATLSQSQKNDGESEISGGDDSSGEDDRVEKPVCLFQKSYVATLTQEQKNTTKPKDATKDLRLCMKEGIGTHPKSGEKTKGWHCKFCL